MAHVVEFQIEKLAGRSETLETHLESDVNVFFGLNGSGKTSLLKILNSVMEGDASLLEDVPFSRATVVVHSIDYARDFTYFASKTLEPPPQASLPGIDLAETRVARRGRSGRRPKWTITPDLPTDINSWQHRYLPTSRLYPGYIHSAEPEFAYKPATESMLNKQFAEELKALWQEFSSGVFREVRQAQADGLAGLLKAFLAERKHGDAAEVHSLSETYNRVRSFLVRQGGDIDKLLGSQEKFGAKLQRDFEFRRVVCDLAAVEVKIEKATRSLREVETLVSRMFAGKKAVKLDNGRIRVEASNGGDIGVELLSSGEKHLLKIFIEVLCADAGPLIIDEPELSLHIDWQRELIGALRTLNPRAQLIIATHSPEILAAVPDRKIVKI